MLSRSLNIPRQGAAIKNLEHACSRWSIDTHSFAWAWGESSLSLEDVVILTRLSLRGASVFDPDKFSRADWENIAELRRLGKLAQSGPQTFNPRRRGFLGRLRTLSRVPIINSGSIWPGYLLSSFVLPNYSADNPSPTVFPLAVLLARGEPIALAPLFLGSLYRQLDLVHADLARSLGRCDHLSMVHTSFLLAYFFEHFHTITPLPRTFLASANRSWAERWFGTSSDASWYEACDIAVNFTPRPYSFTSPGVVGIGQCLLPVRSSVLAASGNDHIAQAVINSTLIALPGWLPFLNNEASGVRELDASTFVAFEPAAAAATEEAEEQATGEEAEESVSAALAKRR
ncbi:hypothetical protein C3L33_23103, partial [Rhododendron williamsianum]